MKTVIIPTRNRPELLDRTVKVILEQFNSTDEIIIVDSSDSPSESELVNGSSRIRYIRTEIKSAAAQRNIGIEQISTSDHVFFLDDDVVPPQDYFLKCIRLLKETGAVGVSGLAINPNAKKFREVPSGISGLLHKIFLLDSKKDGVLLKSGINIPLRKLDDGFSQTDWLIGCSAWCFNSIGDTRFENDFKGQSLAEDVIFSIRMGMKGTLITDSRIILAHDESPIERPANFEFWEMWILNRWRLIKVAKFGWAGVLAYWWANLGQALIFILLILKSESEHIESFRGLQSGVKKVVRKKF